MRADEGAPYLGMIEAARADDGDLNLGRDDVRRPGEASNIVDDRPATWREVFTAMAKAVGAPPPRTVPRWLFRMTAPDVSTASFTVDTSMRVSNAKAKAQLDWHPTYPTYRDGVAAMVSGDS